MSANRTAVPSPSALPPERDLSAPLGILFNLPEPLHTIQILHALICAEQAGYQRRARDEAAAALARVRLSSSQPS